MSDAFFSLRQQQTTPRDEIVAGITTFATMSYVVIAIPHLMLLAGMELAAATTATVLSAALASLYLALVANYPFALAPSMGLTACFTYSIVIASGVSWQQALGAAALASTILILLNLVGLREAISKAIPHPLRVGTTAGLGAMLATIGVKEVELSNVATLTPPALLTLFGTLLLATSLYYRIVAAPLGVIILLALAGVPLSLTRWNSSSASLAPLWLQLELSWDRNFYGAVATFVFIGLFDAAATVAGLAQIGHFVDHAGSMPRIRKTLSADALGSLAGAFFGAPPPRFLPRVCCRYYDRRKNWAHCPLHWTALFGNAAADSPHPLDSLLRHSPHTHRDRIEDDEAAHWVAR